eukprot:1426242-Pyramimonas_sp.AAC.2
MAEETSNDGYWNNVGVVFWNRPKPVSGGAGPTRQCTKSTDHAVMIEMRIYHWHPAAFFANGSSSWTLTRFFWTEDGEVVDKYFNVERTESQERADMIDYVRNQQCQWVSDFFPTDWQEHVSPYLEYDPSMENAWEYFENSGCKLKFERPFLDGANEGGKRAAHGQVGAKTMPPLQPAGGS